MIDSSFGAYIIQQELRKAVQQSGVSTLAIEVTRDLVEKTMHDKYSTQAEAALAEVLVQDTSR